MRNFFNNQQVSICGAYALCWALYLGTNIWDRLNFYNLPTIHQHSAEYQIHKHLRFILLCQVLSIKRGMVCNPELNWPECILLSYVNVLNLRLLLALTSIQVLIFLSDLLILRTLIHSPTLLSLCFISWLPHFCCHFELSQSKTVILSLGILTLIHDLPPLVQVSCQISLTSCTHISA